MFDRIRKRGGEHLATLIAVTLVVFSGFWLPPLSSIMVGGLAVMKTDKTPEREDWESGETLLAPQPESSEIQRLRFDIRRLLKENRLLRIDLKTLRGYRKRMGEDTLVIATEIAGGNSRFGREFWILSGGEEAGVREGALVVQDYQVLARVVGVTKKACIAQKIASTMSRLVVTFPHESGEYIWHGSGARRGWIQIQGRMADKLLGQPVVLSNSLALSGGMTVGKAVGIKHNMKSGEAQLIIECHQPEKDKALYILQPADSTQPDAFVKRDRLAELKQEVRKLELQKLRTEMMER